MSNVSTAVALRNDGASAIIESYRDDLAAIMPSHMKPEVFTRLAISVLSRDENLLRAAQNNPASLMSALWEASRLGLEPGTEQYYITSRKGKNGYEILGMPGYQGEVELIYRAGAVSSVTVEVVREGDKFRWLKGSIDRENPPRWVGPQKQPYHDIDWFGDRGRLKGVYAYAEMKDGSTSKVVVLNRQDIEEAKAYSKGSDESWSPWRKHESSMWMKTAAHRLRKWVPTSAEYMREQLRIVTGVQAEQSAAGAQVPGRQMAAPAEGRTADEFRVMADDAADIGELSAALREAQRAGFAQQGDELFVYFLARKSAIEAQSIVDEPVDAEIVYEHTGHAPGYDPNCDGCRSEQTALDRQMAGVS